MELGRITEQLTCALIGLARAAQGNAAGRSAATHEATLSGMRALLSGAELTRDRADACLRALRLEGDRLLPHGDCHFSLLSLNNLEPDIAASKYALLSGLLSLEPHLAQCRQTQAFEPAMALVYRGFCLVGSAEAGEEAQGLLRQIERMCGVQGPVSHPGLIQYFINVIEVKDLYTQGHSHHVFVVAQAILDSLPEELRRTIDRERFQAAAMLHDVGKVLTPDSVLNKEAGLSPQEWRVMRQHPLNGKKILESGAFADISDWILYHHERMDGRGYYGLEPSLIPLEARIITIADTFSALRTYRIYRPAKSLEETIDIMRQCAGTQLDAELLGHFLALPWEVLETLECNCEICRQRRQALEEKAASGI